MKMFLCATALAALIMTTHPMTEDGLFKYSFDKEVGEAAIPIKIVVTSVEPFNQEEFEKIWLQDIEPDIMNNIDKFM